jgi:predicted GTPase
MFNNQQKYQGRKQEILDLFASLRSFAQKQNEQGYVKQLDEAIKRLDEGKLLVVVCGEFKEGKSSLINALLNEASDDLFPVDSDIATGLVSTISYGEQEKITVIIGEPGQEKQKQIKREEINDYANEQHNKGNIQQARMLVAEVPNSQLKDGLVLVDTPGVGGLNTRHTGITYAFIPNSDVVLFVSDVTAPLKAKELEFVKMIARHCQNLIFVVTKIDMKSRAEYEEVVENNREKLAQVLERPSDRIEIIPISSHNKLAYLKSGDGEDLEDSNFRVLEEKLWQLLNSEKGYILLMRALGEVKPILDEMKIGLQAEFEGCQQRTAQELKNLELQFQEEQERLKGLQAKSSAWQPELNFGLKKINGVVRSFLRDGFVKIRRFAEEYIDNAGMAGNSKEIAGLVEADIDALMSDMGKKLSNEATNLYIQIERVTGLDMDRYRIGILDWEKSQVSVGDVDIKQTGLWEKSLTATRNSMFNATAGGMIGGILGTVVGSLFGGVGALPGGIIGTKLGSLFGGFSGLKQGVKQISEKDMVNAKRELSKVIERYITDCQQLCTDSVDGIILDLERSMQEQLLGQIRRKREMCDRTFQTIQESRKLTQEQAAQKAKELAIPLETLKQLYKRVETLGQTIVTEKEATSATLPKQTSSDSANYGEDWADG